MSPIAHKLLNRVFYIFFVILFVFLYQNEVRAATTGQVYPTLGTSVSESPWSDNAWATPTNIYSDNGATANVTAASYDTGDQTYVLKATGFNFSTIPEGSTINGVTARLNAFYRSGQGSGSIDLCQLLNMSRAKVGTNQCSTAVALTTNTATIIIKGSAIDTWGNALTTAWVKDPDFGIAIGILATAQNADVDIDYVTLEIDYTPPAPSGTVSASPTSCTILSGSSTCTAPFTWSISNATAPNLYNATTANQYSTSASGTNVSYPITNGSNTVQVRDSSSVLNSVAVTGSCVAGTSWNGTICTEPPTVPTVTTPTVTSITTTGATLGANVVSLGVPATISSRGTCWGTSASPTTNCLAEGGTTTGVFTHERTGMSPGTFYYYRGYATNSTDTGYSADGTFTTTGATFAITASSGTNGNVTPSGATNVPHGGSQTYSIIPDTLYDVETLLVDGGPVATSTAYTFINVQAAHTIHATFVRLPTPPVIYTITSSAGPNGTITPLGIVDIAEGGSQSYTAIPDPNYEVAALIVDSATTTGSTYTFTNIQANHTISAMFSALPETPVATTTKQRVPKPIKVTFTGKAFPWAKISILDKELTSEKIIKQEQAVDQTGTFDTSFVGIIEGTHSFALLARDSVGRVSQTKFFQADISKEELIVKEYVILPPTIDLLNGQVTRGKNATIIGSAVPYYTIDIEVDGVPTKGTAALPDGSYKVEVLTGPLSFGKHTVRTRQTNVNERKGSDFSISRNFIVSNLAVVQTDLNGDGMVDIKDWSIFLARFTSRDNDIKKSIDLTNDGKVDISDFSVFIRVVRRVK